MAFKLLSLAWALCSLQSALVAASVNDSPLSVTVTHEGESVGQIKEVNGVKTYLSLPPDKKSENAILYLPDAFGLELLENRLLADTMARAGYVVVLPDYYKNDAVPKNTTGFDMTAWIGRHPPALVDPIIEATIKYMRTELGVKNIGAVGYCFGGRYVARFLAKGKGIQAGFTAHPSLAETAEWQAVAEPLSIAAAETDTILTTAKRRETEDILQKSKITYEVAVYSGTQHGFAVRVDLKDPKQKFAKESAFYQAIRWFDRWVKK